MSIMRRLVSNFLRFRDNLRRRIRHLRHYNIIEPAVNRKSNFDAACDSAAVMNSDAQNSKRSDDASSEDIKLDIAHNDVTRRPQRYDQATQQVVLSS